MTPSERRDVTYWDRLAGSRMREHWPDEAQARARCEALSKTAFAEDVRVVPPVVDLMAALEDSLALVSAPVHREEGE